MRKYNNKSASKNQNITDGITWALCKIAYSQYGSKLYCEELKDAIRGIEVTRAEIDKAYKSNTLNDNLANILFGGLQMDVPEPRSSKTQEYSNNKIPKRSSMNINIATPDKSGATSTADFLAVRKIALEMFNNGSNKTAIKKYLTNDILNPAVNEAQTEYLDTIKKTKVQAERAESQSDNERFLALENTQAKTLELLAQIAAKLA